ncbi:exopolysaccharide biosynthesis protein [Candidatus Nitrosacidococcus tergens]|uniref:Exopolysaccharide synthesis, ExoD n=1 Tax=Candidatus Nitrosacidococcus tergens TaxID=553981 RepID=A0A7G1Q7X1_9GAMM|nr:exopolysaccharide biosynthesis protein [Candidatus Nitrosacidococcus tergens]CAB1274612.1 Exopolysaccharide synthesis, ExoD [Candidatus Nitrosacidococcus tergens]
MLVYSPLIQKLKKIIEKLPSEHVTLIEVRDLIGQEGLIPFVLLLSLIFIIPISIPGMGAICGLVILSIGVSLFFDYPLWLPKSVRNKLISTKALSVVLEHSFIWLNYLVRINHPYRLNWLVAKKFLYKIHSLALILGAILLILPFGFIPLSNTLPGLALFFLAAGLLQYDGIFILLGYLIDIITIIYFTVFIVIGKKMFYEAIQYF